MLRHASSASPLLALSAALLVTGCAGGGSSPAAAPNVPNASAFGVAQRGVAATPRTIDGIVVPPGVTLPLAQRELGSGWLSPAARRVKGILYVADQGNTAIRIYKQKGTNQQPTGEITSGLNDVRWPVRRHEQKPVRLQFRNRDGHRLQAGHQDAVADANGRGFAEVRRRRERRYRVRRELQ